MLKNVGMTIRGVLRVSFMAVAIVGLTSQAQALMTSWNLNCEIGNGSCPDSGVFGTLTLSDTAADEVTVTFDTTVLGATSKDFLLALNTSTTVTNVTVNLPNLLDSFLYSANSINVGPYCQPGGCFDLLIDIKSNAATTPVTMILTGAGLDVADFFEKDSENNLVFAAAHVGNITPGGGSLFIGSSSDTDVPPAALPEPGTVFLFGSGLAALGLWRWKTAKKV